MEGLVVVLLQGRLIVRQVFDSPHADKPKTAPQVRKKVPVLQAMTDYDAEVDARLPAAVVRIVEPVGVGFNAAPLLLTPPLNQ
ncbi:MAG: hypothetical protein AVDCRST_MAG56-854 [uncultured Cytophagales bacterium]|uniref:Uncharacterized protein n=1 Tax=uncultured Cytophagales bacterium TaxID=158755 RepID=A0A6J4HNN4_9SPHI|nr:MAG: hypothetical protein AVDCRST_MAG56-854 [uncultured Cytophagales bacterium]